MSPQKALETIGANLQKQYENWQPRVSEAASLLFLCSLEWNHVLLFVDRIQQEESLALYCWISAGPAVVMMMIHFCYKTKPDEIGHDMIQNIHDATQNVCFETHVQILYDALHIYVHQYQHVSSDGFLKVIENKKFIFAKKF